MAYTFRILVHDGSWVDCGEGPFSDEAAALEFAVAEVGLPWIVVVDGNKPLYFGDASGVFISSQIP